MNRRFPSRLVWFAGGAARPALPSHCRSALAPECQVREIRQRGRRHRTMGVAVVAVVVVVVVAAAAAAVVVVAVAVAVVHRQPRASFLLELSE
jgi:hypothetical protein